VLEQFGENARGRKHWQYQPGAAALCTLLLVAVVFDEFVGNAACVDFVFASSNSGLNTSHFFGIESTIAVVVVTCLIV